MTRTLKTLSIVFVYTSICSAGTTIESEFRAVGPSESMTALFALPGSGTTVNQYSDFVQIEVSGTGQAKAISLGVNDAFYFVNSQSSAVLPEDNGGLFYSFTGDARAVEADGQSIVDLIAFIDGIGFVNAVKPPFSATSEYNFVVDVGVVPRTLTLGTGDGGLFDNTGQFDVAVTQLAPAPEPSSLVLCILAMAGITLIAHRKLCARNGALPSCADGG